ncbi:putative bifunctional diguanylate cyclase/phosphodiesterase [Marinomonas ostreistagni]|uniref:putative bifunctional diguanylate cyclase/phosphodiesterase n=1 Tax=Marinomonas ostreistagni TaxID=359209 RepID=UPI00194DB17C|nr:EAL domain-containing protein [Marinomonas ostreistagni]MBM6551621.1 EAL domain-containing protein [Marinomonas ostreistagni]
MAGAGLYEAKRRGKNQYVLFTEAMRNRSIHSHQEELALTKAIESKQLVLYFQPQLDLDHHTIVGAEALVRWNHPNKGVVYPDQFIPLAEQSGLILDLGRDVIEQSFAYQARRHQLGLFSIKLHINLSAVQLSDSELVPFVEQMMRRYGIPGHLIGFELTETTLLTDLKLAQTTLQQLKDLGISIAVDDFGTGFSSLGQLKNLPVDLLKIDRSFVQEMEIDKDDKMMVEAIIAMAHKLDIMVVAEGVEKSDHLTLLAQLDCDMAQGYYIARPIPEADFNEFSEHFTLATSCNK